MPTPRRNPARNRKPDRVGALELLASTRHGLTESLLLAHGVTVPLMVELARAGLASATTERVVAGSRTMEVARLRITDQGRRVLAKAKR